MLIFVPSVIDNLQSGDTVFVTMGLFDDAQNLLVTSEPVNFCNNLVGSDCTAQGTYSFSTKLKLGTPNSGSQSEFYPVIQMAFSTRKDYGFNLGAVNMRCPKEAYVNWGEAPRKKTSFASENGMLIGTGIAVVLVGGFVWYQAREAQRDDPLDPNPRVSKHPLVQIT